MGENRLGSGQQSCTRGKGRNAEPGSVITSKVPGALDAELDAYLDRELFIQSSAGLKPASAERPAERLQGVLALAAEEEQWLRARPASEEPAENSKDLEGGACPIPEHLKPQPVPEVRPPAPVAVPVVLAAPPPPEQAWIPTPAPLPGLAPVPPPQQPWAPPVAAPMPPVAPTVVTVAPRTHWLAAGALVGVGAAGLLAAGLLWMARGSLPGKAEVLSAYTPAGAVTAVAPAPVAPVAEPARTGESPSVPAVQPSPAPALGAVVPAQAPAPSAPVVSPEPVPTSASPEAVEPRRTSAPAQKAPVVTRAPERVVVEDPSLADSEEETPLLEEAPPPTRAPAQVAKATPKRDTSKPEEYAELDQDFARELGFTDDSTPKEPERKGVKSVWIPPDPSANLPEGLTPADIQQVVVANQPAIASCVKRHKELTGASGGAFTLQWTVLPDGSTSRVAMETVEMRGTPLSRCIEGLVRNWKFPKHRVQQKPIRFPFRF